MITIEGGTRDEVVAFAERKGLSACLKNATGIRSLSRAIAESDGKSSSYAVKMSNEPLSASEEIKLSKLLKRTLNNRD